MVFFQKKGIKWLDNIKNNKSLYGMKLLYRLINKCVFATKRMFEFQLADDHSHHQFQPDIVYWDWELCSLVWFQTFKVRKMTLNTEFSWIYLWSVSVTGMYHQARPWSQFLNQNCWTTLFRKYLRCWWTGRWKKLEENFSEYVITKVKHPCRCQCLQSYSY